MSFFETEILRFDSATDRLRFTKNLMAVLHTLLYMDQADYLTISGNFTATSVRLLQFPCIVAVR